MTLRMTIDTQFHFYFYLESNLHATHGRSNHTPYRHNNVEANNYVPTCAFIVWSIRCDNVTDASRHSIRCDGLSAKVLQTNV